MTVEPPPPSLHPDAGGSWVLLGGLESASVVPLALHTLSTLNQKAEILSLGIVMGQSVRRKAKAGADEAILCP